jgi:molybdopterin/thiamine biosynthesis adenylyltransferase
MNAIFDEARFSRNILLNGIGIKGQEIFCSSSIVCVGSGGLASHVLPILASCGIGKLAIIDFDEIAPSNLPRQTMFREQDIGLKKADCAKKFLLERNSSCQIEAICENGANVLHKIVQNYDIILDLTDSLASRLNSNNVSLLHKKPFFTGSARGFAGHIYSFGNHLKSNQIPCYACLFNDIPEQEVTQMQGLGIFPPIVEIIGGFVAANVLKYLAGMKLDFQEFLILDVINGNKKTKILKDTKCKACGE